MCDVGCGTRLSCGVGCGFLGLRVLFCSLIQIWIVFGFWFILRFVVILRFDLIVEVAGVGSVEDGDGAAAFLIRSFGFVEGVDEGAERVEAGGGEFGCVGGHGGSPKKNGKAQMANRK